MAIENVLLIGNWELCLTIINALFLPTAQPENLPYRVTVLTYPSQTLDLPSQVPQSTVQHKKSDFSFESLQSAFVGQDLVISTTAGGDSDLQIRIIDAAVAAGVRRFIPREFGHDTLNKAIQARISKYAGQAKVIDHIKKASNAQPGFEWVGIATGYTLDTNLISGDLGLDMEWHSATIHGIGTEPFAASSLERVGQIVASVISHWEDVKNQYIYAAGVVTSAIEVLRSAEKATSQEWTVGNYDVEECITEGQLRLKRGYLASGMFLLERSVLYDEEMDASAPFRLHNANEVLQLQPESVNTIVVMAYHDLTHRGKPGCGCSSRCRPAEAERVAALPVFRLYSDIGRSWPISNAR
ncbi:isoflavone reductase family protein [Cucurbitaria berberidis CBS 394.84]|uniref:Isoflavone reductase family protein n=1 Tax=Cucurbitaria berberidis CBS 394.84 TaxID=1168544 RepID=A0A9P4GCV1_9PLEO|nr:isoflavone reductase family protein [Cucurbitaria berberidis CBS 394.84]KAF1843164.1 isoflavone reductase family protein [Cucurbitaria berberidis CBS 394.84]